MGLRHKPVPHCPGNPVTVTATEKWLPGQLARARNRDWVVLPQEEPGIVRLRPIDGTEAETIGVYLPLEPDALAPTEYQPPDPEAAGDFSGAQLLRDALRLNLRSGAGPFRSMGRLSVEPRPYQFVPLIMALGLDPVRLLIADDVGVGKTIEAGMIARELLDRGTALRICVLCPPHLCEQWNEELRTKFNIDTAVIQSSSISRLERSLPRSDVSLYRHYRHLVVSIDFAKSDRNRQPFLANAPDLIIVDEAHTAARPRGDRGVAQQLRYRLARDLAKDPKRHVILATATPHSGIEESFRSLLGLLNPSFDSAEEADLPRGELTPHIIQRKRNDLKRWLDVDTPFPDREAVERSYRMSSEYHSLYQEILTYCREYVTSRGMAEQRQRVRYWAALSILRCVLSSPWAARAALENRRSSTNESPHEDPAKDGELTDELFGRQLVDSADEDQATDYVPAVSMEDLNDRAAATEERRLSTFLKRAEALAGPEHDAKVKEVISAVSELLRDGYHPIVYCRFIQTAYYVEDQLNRQLQSRHSGLRVRAVTGNDGDSEQRKEIVLDLAQHPARVLVATDCLSEGVNLQEHYDAVVHYDLPWNPNRLEQRDGRVDRFGQNNPTIKTVLLYGSDNEVDQVVMEVLLRKAKTIRERLGINVPVPVEAEQVVNTLVDNVLLRARGQGRQAVLPLQTGTVSRLHETWDQVADQEEETRAYFAQHGIEPDAVARELRDMEPVLGTAADMRRFLTNALQRFNGELSTTNQAGVFRLNPGDLRDNITGRDGRLKFPMNVSFDGMPQNGVTLLGRNHPAVSAAAEAVLSKALEAQDSRFARAGAIVTPEVERRTAVLILRLRFMIQTSNAGAESQQFAEEVVAVAFEGRRGSISWIPEDLDGDQNNALRLLAEAQPVANLSTLERTENVRWALDRLQDGWHEDIITQRAAALEAAHSRLRKAVPGGHATVVPHCPPDIIGCYVLTPSGV